MKKSEKVMRDKKFRMNEWEYIKRKRDTETVIVYEKETYKEHAYNIDT